MDFRGRLGFSEYNSDTYAPIAFNPVVTVAGIGPDDDIRTLATIVTYLQLFDWILASHRLDGLDNILKRKRSETLKVITLIKLHNQ